jgi:hypothetical protein
MKQVIRKLAANRAASVRQPTRRVAIMVPMPTPVLSEDEEVSMRHLRAHLDHYDKFLLVPQGMGIRMEGFTVVELDRKHFGSAANHNRMLYRTDFWEKFADYEYVLMYHLDALVFSDRLLEWCDQDLDYIGSPFLICKDAPWVKVERCGNGGFALYRVPSVLKVLWNRYHADPSKYLEDHCSRFLAFQSKVLKPLRMAAPSWIKNSAPQNLRGQLRKMDRAEVNERGNDLFWSDMAKTFFPAFKVGTLEQGLAFSFEMEPRRCLERTGGVMPFGCHAWARYDKAFWEGRILKDGQQAAEKHHPATLTT